MNRELGKGAMGVVYLGRDPVIGRLVALKTIRAVSEDDVEQREFQERFLREAQAAGILSHPNIVTVHDVGEDSTTETSFIAMEYVEGKNLKQLLSEKTPFSSERVAEIVGQVAEALDYAHRRGIVHRDVKPANIIITPEGQVKITDFGIAKTEKSNLTTTGQFLGTPNYMSPEQITGDAVDGRSDLFSLGVVLYELLTRKKPFSADNLTSISYKIVHEQFVPPETYDASIPPEFASVLEKALSKDPGERFQRGNDFALALYEFKAREEERQMLRDLGQMVAEAEKLGSVAAVTAPPTSLPRPAAPAPVPPAPPPAVGRSPFDILGAAPASSAPQASRLVEDDLATREVSRPLPATAFVVPSAAGAAKPDEGSVERSDDWQLDEPTRSKKGSHPPTPPVLPLDDEVPDVDASLPGPEVVEPPAARSRGLAVSPLDDVPSAPGLSDDRPDGATEIIRVDGMAGFSPAPERLDRPTEILTPIAPPGPAPAVPVPPVPASPQPAPVPQFVDRPTEILLAIPPPVPAPEAPVAVVPPSQPSFVDRPTEILRAIPAPVDEKPSGRAAASPPAAPTPASSGTDRPTEILRSPFPPPASGSGSPLPDSGNEGEEGATERIVDAMKLVAAGAPAPKAPSRPSPAELPGKPVSSPALRTPAPSQPPPPTHLPPVELEPIPEPPPKPPSVPQPLMKRSINGLFVALIIGVVLLAAAVTAGVLWSKKVKLDEQAAALDEDREREVKELKELMEAGNRLLAAGNGSQALEKFREVIRRKPDSAAARDGLARAEELARTRQAGEEIGREVETRLAAARQAAETGKFDDALNELSAVLLLQPENADALSIRESVKAAKAEMIAAEKKAAAELAKKKKPTPVPTPVRVVKPVVPVEPPKVATPTPGNARIRIVFQSPAPEGYVMVRRNDKEVFRRQFDFGRKSAGGLVEGSIDIPSGPASIKAWAIPTNRSFNGYKAVELVIPGGESRTLALELNADKELVVTLR
ncbi:MAG: protein kinase [Holophagales bacterium]|nr:protein kinase [Holophagales bacterium]